MGAWAPAVVEAAFRAWRAGTGPFLPYCRSTPFVSLRYLEGELRPGETITLPEPLPPVAAPLLLVDLPAALAVAVGVALWEREGRWPIPALLTWFHPHGTVGDRQTAEILVGSPPALTAGSASRWALLLDQERYQEGPLTPDRFNNQYELSEEDLPTAQELKAVGIDSVALLTDARPKADLERYLVYLAQQSISVQHHLIER